LPAERAGIQVGDRLLFVDGRDVRELGTRGINYLLRGPVGSKVTLVVQTLGAASRKVTLERVQR
jgi:carboxyl-terminal processing protease